MTLNEIRIPVRLSPSHHRLTYHWTDKSLVILHDVTLGPRHTKHIKNHEVPHDRVLRITFNSEKRELLVAYLKPKNLKNHKAAEVVVLNGTVHGVENHVVESWAHSAMKVLYEDRGIHPFRRLLVFVNPHGGVKRGVKLFTKIVEPIFRAAGCVLTIIRTDRQGHAYDVVKTLPFEYDAIVTVSGDGLIHEVINGLAQHAEPIKALGIPIAPIPAGSGNGLSLNLLGIEHGFDVPTAALNIIKGRPMKIDLFSVVQNGKRSFSFMSQALGLMADLDLDTEHLRWMGDTRFMYGLLRGLIQLEPCPVELSVKVAESDKDRMAEIAHARLREPTPETEDREKANVNHTALPPLKYLPDDQDGWQTIDEPILYIYAGQGPYVARDYMAFPVSLPDDGFIDIMAMPLSTRSDILTNISGAATGENFWFPKLRYFKAHAYRVKPLSKKGNLSVDGERFPFEEFQVEVHAGLGTLLSCHGRYRTEFKPRPQNTQKT